MALTLSKNGILILLDSENGTNQNIIVQILNLKEIKNGKHIPCHISDGYRKIKAVISAERQQFTDQSHNYAIIRIKQHQIIKTNGLIRGVQIQDLEVEGLYPEMIGDPVGYESAELSDNASNYFDPDKIKSKTTRKKPIEVLEKSEKKKPIVLTLDESVEDITINTLKDSDKISDLYTDLPNWQIVCRVTDMAYKEFISKKSNKFTQILTIELMDRTGMKIEGTIFGEYAKELSGKLQLNALYRISKGQIREENYRTNKGPKYSKYNINFNQNSEFKLLHDNSMIPQFDETQYYSVKQVLSERDAERQYDLVGILTDVGEERNLTDKNGKPLTKRVIAVSDPENNQTIEVTLWRDIKLDESLKGKTVLLKNFKISEYNGNITLNSLFKSQIKPLEHHRYRQYEDNINADQFKQVSHAQPTYVDPQDAIRSIKKLQNEIEYMEQDQTLYSTLHAFVSLISFKGKWYYDSCPKCKKGGATSQSTCLNCDAFIQQPIPRFILPIQIADYTGSIWTTAFDDFASTILQGKDINSLKGYDQVKLREQGQKRIFQEFRFRIATKKEQKGIKHTIVGKPYEINVEKTTLENLSRIMEYE